MKPDFKKIVAKKDNYFLLDEELSKLNLIKQTIAFIILPHFIVKYYIFFSKNVNIESSFF